MAVSEIRINWVTFKVVRTSVPGEFKVRVADGSIGCQVERKERAYFTDNKEDAYGTMIAMAKEELENQAKEIRQEVKRRI